jgi:hypothetical protein
VKVSLHTDFVGDLIELGDAKVASRVLRKLFDKGGKFIVQAKDDHRYHGIKDGWIRYISQGGPAFRVIYTKSDDTVLLYRVGPHSIEDNLTAPAGDEGHLVVQDSVLAALKSSPGNQFSVAEMAEAQAMADELTTPEPVKGSSLLQNHADRFLYGNLLGRRFLPHRDVYLMSPYLSLDLLRPTHVFGQMLDELVDGGATVWLISRPPKASELSHFEHLSARSINIFFCEEVHAKVYAFILNRDQLKPDQKAYKDLIVVGSANLTWPGINPKGLLADKLQYELSYDVPTDDWPDVEKFLLHVTGLSTELDVVRSNLAN